MATTITGYSETNTRRLQFKKKKKIQTQSEM